MRLSEALSNLIDFSAKFLSEAEQKEAEYISELREAVLKKAEIANLDPDLDELEALMFEAWDNDIPIEVAKELIWLVVNPR